jgi:hypothetical protein
MCFSLLASVTAGTTLSAAGVATVRMTHRRAELPLAVIPLLFGVQQLTEGLVWWSLDHDDARLNAASTLAYMLFSHVLWPVFVPLAILCLEVVPWRRRALAGLVGVGIAVALDGLSIVVRAPSTSHVTGSSIQYAMPGLVMIAFYLLATCVAMMVSSHRLLRLMGATALGLALVSLWLYTAVFVSVWCFFSAVLTSLVLVYFWSLYGPRRPAWTNRGSTEQRTKVS